MTEHSSTVQPSLSVLTPEQLEQAHQFSLEILSAVGLRVDSARALTIFSRAGAGIRVEGERVFIQPEMVDWALKSAPESFPVFNRHGELAFTAGEGAHYGVGVTNLFYQDPQTDEISPFSRAHMALGTRLANSLPAYELVSTLGVIRDVPAGQDDLYAVLEMAANTTKPLVILNSDEKQFAASLDLLEKLSGGLAEKPFAIPYFNPVTPLIINRETGDKMITAIERGLPVIYSNYGMAGTTTPITAAGTLALLNAELLAGLVLSQLVRAGAPIILGSLPAFFDMKSMMDFYDPQTILINAVCAEMMAHYHIPHAGTSGSGLGWGADLPAAGMHWLNHLTTSLGKTGLVPFVGGSLGSKAFSPTSVVYANDVILQARHFTTGFPLNHTSAALDEIAAVGPGGNFLMTKSTRQNFRNAYFTSGIFPRLSLEKWEEKGRPEASSLLRQETLRQIAESKAPDDHDHILATGEEFIRQRG
ncbi:MAG: trimethylamine methyltransferase family protein [Chloroflexi bacterium]|nr:trimethylamine methyltransferase family protein [Chloroflexota bacterium]